MKRYLWLQLLVLYLASAFCMFFLLNTYGLDRYEQKLIEDKKSLLYNEATSISSDYMSSYYDKQLSLPYLSTQIKTIGSILEARIWIVNTKGDIISDTSKNITEGEEVNVLSIDPDFFDETFSDYTELEGVLTEPMVTVVYPVVYKYQTRGYIVIHSSLQEIQRDSVYVIDTINICLLIFLVFLLVIFVGLYYLTLHPLGKINKAAQEYAKGNYSYPLKLKRQDEYATLAASVSYMAGELDKLDDYQKKFVANISHDFRSPLTSIKGYAEALQDGTIPYELKDKYLGIILFETERLNKLTTSLLALNSFENHGTLLDIVSFDINNIIKKTAESFEGTCTQKKITLNLIFSSKETLVNADMGKIQQVLYNLLDNAIKFSHHNSTIKISTVEKGDKVFVSVKDNGIGIPKESIKKIWERFYKTDTSRGKDKKGTGLGLSIAKEIITAHDENINVISTEGVGTEFLFTLARTEGFLI
ncbi:two-component sensor histidine kinase [Anaerocolumna cellulosilytica]|uniref:histidine kinase n=1 Tax=Anaerocolumna cellulosilytica TaxID=433286 RepID=A0A6S6R098_9FIRM|nr:HAMP domain-containing sensor histidine kinase [Anaerocolumna cellulosilytica]MBB5196939.1 signal transduction histidine kinase [Anaerocolumna cellulosilytica]BCJ92661.1 two-component sensor histidine kinase [Anaerocolumna cellulosilytica]